MTEHTPHGEAIAIVGTAARFPGAPDVDQFWRNLRDGVESIATFSDSDLLASGVDPDLIGKPNYVRAGGVLDTAEYFDAAFFGYTAREAALMDPQHRVLMECAWEALERAGHDPRSFAGRIGVYAGSGPNTYLFNLLGGRELMPTAEDFQLILGNDRDHLATSISYKLDLRGPSLTIQTACSTSLVAVHLACQSLLIGECDLALAGGVSISVPQRAGYLHQEGMILSPDGHCRAFDSRAQGTVGSSGAGLVVLRRLSDALADGDTVLAVIRGSAVNNDGSAKAGFTAPSVQGQAEVIAEALAVADVDASTISYVEAHGTGTPLGDPIEIAALAQAFGDARSERGCAIGSVKTNIGHTDAAAGVAGLIKVALALHHGQIPPTLHFEQANPKLGIHDTPFHVNAHLADWPSNSTTPRRAGVSSFGIGGTNAHVVLEEAPAPPHPVDSSGSEQLLVLSARTGAALETATRNLITHAHQHPDLNLADVARTLQVGRRAFEHRRALVATSLADALDALQQPSTERLTGVRSADDPAVAFMFPGQGAQYGGMLGGLYRGDASVRQLVDTCASLLRPRLGLDLREALFATEGAGLDQTWLTQPALFVTEYVLARLWMDWGIRPRALIGHSLGEYTAACLAGVFSLEDGLALVAARGRLMQGAPAGAMLAVPLAERETQLLLGQHLSLAACNGPTQCVVAGPEEHVADLQQRLAEKGTPTQRLRTSHAFHSWLLDPIADAFAAHVAAVDLHEPSIPFISNVSGTWITAAEATDPAYWAAQLRRTVRFAAGVDQLAEMPAQALLEVGPGRALGGLVRGLLARRPTPPRILSSFKGRGDGERAALLDALGQLWVMGAPVDWSAVQANQPARRIPLPTYPFERRRHWVDPQPGTRTGSRIQPAPLQPDPAPQLAKAPIVALEVPDGYVAPRNDTERIVAGVWRELLGIDQISIGDDFLQLGGHSLLATQVVAKLRERFNVELPLSHFLQNPTVEGLSLAIERERLERSDVDDVARLLGEIAQLSADEVSRLLADGRQPERDVSLA